MEKAYTDDEMDFADEWEFLPANDFIDDFHTHEVTKKALISPGFDPKRVFDMDYFSDSRYLIEKPEKSSVATKGVDYDEQLVVHEVPKLVQAQLEQPLKEIMEVPKLVVVGEDHQDPIPQVFFKKMKENEFADMKMDSPRAGSRGIIKAQTDQTGSVIQFEDKEQHNKQEATAMEPKSTCCKAEGDQGMKSLLDSNITEETKWEGSSTNNGGLNILGWRLTGIGALCSIGLTAATVCILIFGSRKRNKHHQLNHKIQFQIYADEKRINQVVQQANKLNQAMSAVRNGPLTRAHITFGGYYDGI